MEKMFLSEHFSHPFALPFEPLDFADEGPDISLGFPTSRNSSEKWGTRLWLKPA